MHTLSTPERACNLYNHPDFTFTFPRRSMAVACGVKAWMSASSSCAPRRSPSSTSPCVCVGAAMSSRPKEKGCTASDNFQDWKLPAAACPPCSDARCPCRDSHLYCNFAGTRPSATSRSKPQGQRSAIYRKWLPIRYGIIDHWRFGPWPDSTLLLLTARNRAGEQER